VAEGINIYALLVGMLIISVTMETSMVISPNMKVELPWQSCFSNSGHTSKRCKSHYNRDNCELMFIAALFTIEKL
jgi:hypothetical protein